MDLINTTKAAIYTRVSTHMQADRDSIQVQKRELIAYADMVLGIKDYEIFEDSGYSAKNTDRPSYQIMMERLRTGEFSHLLIWKIDRISRNIIDFASMYSELKELGVAFVSKNEQFDTSTAIGEAMLKIILVFAELERKMTAERVSAVMLSRANNGQWNGGRVPYGYTYNSDSKEFAINERESEIYKRIVSMYEENQSLLHIARTLTDSGILTRNGHNWSPTGIHKILTNIFYTGSYRYNVRSEKNKWQKNDESEWITIENHHPALIDIERFNHIQYVLKRNKRGGVKQGDTYERKNIHIFSGLIRCGYCGANMAATLDKRRANGWRPSLYGCSSRRKSNNICSNKYVSDVTVGPFIFSFIRNFLSARDNVPSDTKRLKSLLLSGKEMSGADISEDNLTLILDALKSESSGLEYKAPEPADERTELSDLYAKKNKFETALIRLKNLYLYGDKEISEKDYIIEKQKIMAELTKSEKAISDMIASGYTENYSEKSFVEKASYFLMVEALTSPKKLDFEKFIRTSDKSVPKSFLNTVIDFIEVKDGNVTSVTFKSGLYCKFEYK